MILFCQKTLYISQGDWDWIAVDEVSSNHYVLSMMIRYGDIFSPLSNTENDLSRIALVTGITIISFKIFITYGKMLQALTKSILKFIKSI